ncbi:MAG: glycosyltransferase [Alphaproteobacteria bacterium]
MSGAPHVFFYVQHLLGIGHLKRAATLARAMQAGGLGVTIVSGGHDVPGLDIGRAELLQLPPIRAVDKFFKILVDEADRVIDDAFKAARRDRLLAAFAARRPAALIIELFPFGRRQLAFELLPLIEAARAARIPVICSVRDILVAPPKPERIDEMLDRAERLFDLILVHGDPNLIPFDATFPLAHRIASRIRYTGYVVDQRMPAAHRGSAAERGDVIVSAGGGAVSEPLLDAAFAARPLTRFRDRPWRVLIGHNLPDEKFRAYCDAAGAGFVVERARPDFTRLLGQAALSVSQGGYNTVLEVLSAGLRAVVVPYSGGLETEQTLRARLLAERGLLQAVPEEGLTPAGLALAIERVAAGPAPDLAGLDTGGGEKTAAMIAAAISG